MFLVGFWSKVIWYFSNAMEGSIKIIPNEILQVPHKTCHALKNLSCLVTESQGLSTQIPEKTSKKKYGRWKLYWESRNPVEGLRKWRWTCSEGSTPSSQTEETVMGLFNVSCIKADYCYYFYTAELIPRFSKIYWKFEKIPGKTYKKSHHWEVCFPSCD